mmetsp:Transcript_5776/g.18490  ORF Transcript_5776/g.18490 Transcript_5776/m.18490 type:complete len:105 (-) Transcript_5776:37-351(-)
MRRFQNQWIVHGMRTIFLAAVSARSFEAMDCQAPRAINGSKSVGRWRVKAGDRDWTKRTRHKNLPWRCLTKRMKKEESGRSRSNMAGSGSEYLGKIYKDNLFFD